MHSILARCTFLKEELHAETRLWYPENALEIRTYMFVLIPEYLDIWSRVWQQEPLARTLTIVISVQIKLLNFIQSSIQFSFMLIFFFSEKLFSLLLLFHRKETRKCDVDKKFVVMMTPLCHFQIWSTYWNYTHKKEGTSTF